MQKLDSELDKPLKIKKNTPKILEHVKNARGMHINYKFGVIVVHTNILCRMNKVWFWSILEKNIFSWSKLLIFVMLFIIIIVVVLVVSRLVLVVVVRRHLSRHHISNRAKRIVAINGHFNDHWHNSFRNANGSRVVWRERESFPTRHRHNVQRQDWPFLSG